MTTKTGSIKEMQGLLDQLRVASIAMAFSTMTLCVPSSAAAQGGDLFGWKVADAGDLDGDGVSDLLVTDKFGPLQESPSPGRAWVISGVTRKPLLSLTGRQAGDSFGAGVAAKFRRNANEEAPLFAVSADGGGDGMGYVRVFSKDGSIVYEVEEPATPGGSLVLANVGDLDGDGQDNLAIGVPQFSDGPGANRGCVVTRTAKGSEIYRVRGVRSGARLGYSICSIEDVDGDGVGELLASAVPMGQLKTAHDAGRGYAVVLSGKEGRLLGELHPTEGGRWYGSAVAAVGDLDGDGVADFAVGQPHDRLGSRVLVYSGKDLSLMRQILAPGSGDHTPYSAFGSAVHGVGDVDGDGVPDIAIGCPASGLDAAFVSVVSGRTGAELWRVEAPSQVNGGLGLGFGTALAGGAEAGMLLVGAAEPRSWMDLPGAVYAIDARSKKVLWRLGVAEF